MDKIKFEMAYTGGELNKLNGDYGISAASNSVPVMKLIKVHCPNSKNELYDLILFHYKNDCECGIKKVSNWVSVSSWVSFAQFKNGI